MKIFIRQNWLLLLSIIYILSPIDIIPEFIAGPLGLVDDLGLILLLLATAFYRYTRKPKDKEQVKEISD